MPKYVLENDERKEFMETTLSLQQRLAQSVLIFVMFLVTLLSVFVKNIFADEIQSSISNLTQEQVANTYRIVR